jgi:hypothetical protein
MTTYLQPLLNAHVLPGRTLTVAAATLLEVKQGLRAVIQYEMYGLSPEIGNAVIGKLYGDVWQALRVYRTMVMLADRFQGFAELAVPRPLGYIPTLAMLFYVPAKGGYLDEVIDTDHAPRWMSLAGAWLSVLHRQDVALDRQFNLPVELRNLQLWAVLVGQTYPDLADTPRQLIDELEKRATNMRFESTVPIHKDFHHRHVIIGRDVTVIDFDEARLGDPAFDLAHFCANFRLLAFEERVPLSRLSSLEHIFLASYAERTGWTPDQKFAFFFGYSSIKIAKQLCTSRGPRVRHGCTDTSRQAGLILKQGLAMLLDGTASPMVVLP